MSFFKGLQWFEWLFIGVFVAVLGACYSLWQKNESQAEQLGTTKVVEQVLTETSKYKDESATITDTVVDDFAKSKTDAQYELDQSRKGAIDEYINMAGSQPQAEPAPVVKTPAVPTRPPKATPVGPVDDPVADAVRIGALADRMHEHYCKAAPERGRNCTPVSTDR